MENVLLTPSRHPSASYGRRATELSEASAPFLSRSCMGFAPGANGAPRSRPSGVAPVARPYITFEVMVNTDTVSYTHLTLPTNREV